jgi:hypothetical protein
VSGIAILMRRRLMTVWLWVGLFVAAVIWDFVDHQLTVRAMMQPIRFAAMDSRDTFYLSSAGSFDTSQHIHAEVARLAAETIFNRNPEGYDDPDRLERLFNPTTTKALQGQLEKDADAFRAQQIHQKFESGTIRELRVDPARALVSVEGQVFRHALFNGSSVDESKPVTVFLELTANNDMAHNGRYPLVVTAYEARFHERQ